MHEIVVELTYRPQTDPLNGALASHPEMRTKSIAHSAAKGWCWKSEYAMGTPEGIDELRDLVDNDNDWRDHIESDDRASKSRVEVLDGGNNHLLVASMWPRGSEAASISELAHDHLGPVLMMEVRRRERTAIWHFKFPESSNASRFLSALEEARPDEVSVSVERIKEVQGQFSDATLTHEELPWEQYTVLKKAVEYGYYETPREISLEELAKRLDVARSTLSYRLRRAEAFLAEKYLRSVPPFTSKPNGEERTPEQIIEQHI